jgi:HD-GYP domain-containing protein (c-di-GMP phosphodiesterase class II)
MVRMSDLVRGAGRTSAPAPAAAVPTEESRDAPTPSAEPVRVRMTTLAAPAGAASAAAEPPLGGRADAEIPPHGAAEAEALFTELRMQLERVHDAMRAGRPWPWAELEAVVDRALEMLERAGELFWVANRPAAPPNADYLAFHQARVAVLAMRLGIVLRFGRHQLLELGLAGALIDVGLWQLAPGALQRLDALSAEEQVQFRAHPRAAAELIRRWAPADSTVADMVLQHHERELGQGFPQRLAGAAIRPESKLLGLVDTYTGLTAPASLRPGLRPHEAILDIVRSKHELFPAPLIKTLLTEISVFPPGTLVRLNTGEVGCVVAVNRDHPLRPRVQIYDGKGVPPGAGPKMLDLSEAPFLYITGSVAEGAQ